MQRTYTDFLLLLGEAAPCFPWIITIDHRLGTWTPEGFECDPITAVCARLTHQYFDPGQYAEAARWLGLHPTIADLIAAASDLDGSYNAHVRADLVRQTGLWEPWAPEGKWNDQSFQQIPYPHHWDRPIRPGGLTATTARPAAGQELWRCIGAPRNAPSPLPPSAITEKPPVVCSPRSALSAIPAASCSHRAPARGRAGYAASCAEAQRP